MTHKRITPQGMAMGANAARMTNAFTAKPDVSWLKKQERDRKTSEAMRRVVERPASKQRQKLANLLERK